MKILDRFIRIGLFAMIALSLYLSWKIWTNSGNQEVDKTNATTEVMQNLKKPKDVFLPTHFFYHEAENEYQYTNRESLLTNFTTEFLQMEWGQLLSFSPSKDKDVFFQEEESVELLFPAVLDLEYYLEINGKLVKDKLTPGQQFNRIVLSLKDKKLYFIDDEKNSGYELTLDGNFKKIASLLKDEDNRFTKVEHHPSDHRVPFRFEEDLKFKTYSYILGMQSYTVFSQAFFDSDEEIISNDDTDSKDVSLLSDNGSSLKASYTTGEVVYSGRYDPEVNNPQGRHNLFNESYYYVQKLANAMGTIRYFDSDGEQIVYRNFVEGFPIFSEDKKGRVELRLANQNIQIATNQETIQVPIPSAEVVTLRNSTDVLNELEAEGLDLKKIEGMQVGYTWTLNQETKQVIDLVPEWYLKVNGVWDTNKDVIRMIREGLVS